VTFPHPPSPSSFGARPGPPPGGFRPAPPAAQPASTQPAPAQPSDGTAVEGATGHPAVDAVLQSLANAARLAPADQIAEYEAAHRVLQETLSGIDA
jgi:hypothetical protein